VLLQLGAKAAGGHPYDGVYFRIKRGIAVKYLHAQPVFLQPIALARQGVLYDIAQKTLQIIGVTKGRAGQ
jgi:hypothetical protein